MEFTKYEPGEVPPITYDCPFHEGEVWPCPKCVAWVLFNPDEKKVS